MRIPSPREHCILGVDPLFYDALSGEFTSPTDPQGRAHTLGRLAYAAYSRGEEVDHPEITTPHNSSLYARAFRYTPSWAPITATALCNDDNSIHMYLHGIMLSGTPGELTVYNDFPGNDPGMQIVTEDSTFFRLELGSELEVARLAATTAAQRYFNGLT